MALRAQLTETSVFKLNREQDMPNRRKTDKCWLNRQWNRWTPHIEIGAWLSMAGIVFTATAWAASHYIHDAIANDPNILLLQQQVQPIPSIEQEIIDMHKEIHEIFKAVVSHGR